MKKNTNKKLKLKKDIVAKLGQKEMSKVAGGQNLLSFLGEICYSGIKDCGGN